MNKRILRWLLIAASAPAFLFCVIAVMTWPKMFVSEGRELTGRSIELQSQARILRGGREGWAADVWQISEADAAKLAADRAALGEYPMWSAAALDGYTRVRWQTPAQLEAGRDRLLLSILRPPPNAPAVPITPNLSPRTDVQAIDLALWLSQQDGVLVAGWYKVSTHGGGVTDCHIYLLDLKRRLMVTLSLLT